MEMVRSDFAKAFGGEGSGGEAALVQDVGARLCLRPLEEGVVVSRILVF